MPPEDGPVTRHATLVRWLDRGLLLEGPSNSGKSDLALRLIEAGAVLVADDVVRLWRRGERLIGGPLGEGGLIEVRGHGIFRLPSLKETELHASFGLAPFGRPNRLPDSETVTVLGVVLPRWPFDPRPPSAVVRLRVLLTRERVA